MKLKWFLKSPLRGYILMEENESGELINTYKFDNMWDAIKFYRENAA